MLAMKNKVPLSLVLQIMISSFVHANIFFRVMLLPVEEEGEEYSQYPTRISSKPLLREGINNNILKRDQHHAVRRARAVEGAPPQQQIKKMHPECEVGHPLSLEEPFHDWRKKRTLLCVQFKMYGFQDNRGKTHHYLKQDDDDDNDHNDITSSINVLLGTLAMEAFNQIYNERTAMRATDFEVMYSTDEKWIDGGVTTMNDDDGDHHHLDSNRLLERVEWQVGLRLHGTDPFQMLQSNRQPNSSFLHPSTNKIANAVCRTLSNKKWKIERFKTIIIAKCEHTSV